MGDQEEVAEKGQGVVRIALSGSGIARRSEGGAGEGDRRADRRTAEAGQIRGSDQRRGGGAANPRAGPQD